MLASKLFRGLFLSVGLAHVRIFTRMLLAALALVVPSTARAVPGDPDMSFGSSGLATVPMTTSIDQAYGAVGVGFRYVTGRAIRGSDAHLFLSKFLPEGTLDPTFGSAGRTMLRLEYPSDGIMVRQQPDFKLLVVGTHYVPNAFEIMVARFNSDGSLDATFGTNGAYTRRVGSGSYGMAVNIQGDGKILVAGSANDLTNGTVDMAILRLNGDGTPDATFGTAGLTTLDFRGGFDEANGVSEVAANKILVIGTAGSAVGLDFAIARLNPNGTVDTTFGPPAQNGLVLIDVGGNLDEAETMSVGNDVIWLGGTSLRTSDNLYAFSLAKLTLDGILDTTFGGAGVAMVSSGIGHTYGKSIAPSPGKILIGGVSSGRPVMARFNVDGTLDATLGSGGVVVDPDYGGMIGVGYEGSTIIAVGTGLGSADPFSHDILRLRYTATGAPDTTFGSGGRTLTNLFTLSWDVRAVTTTPEGKVVIAGSLGDPFDSDFAALRLAANGARDGFGLGGVRSVGFGRGDDRANAMLPRPDGALILGGRSNVLGTSSFALARLITDGNLDTNFGTGGRTTHTMGLGSAEIHALAAAPGGKIIAAGQALVASGNSDFALARYLANGVLDATFGTGGIVITPFGPEPDIAQAVAVQLDGKIVVAGYTRSSGVFDFAVARYDASGTLDSTFGADGKVTIAVGASNDLGHALALLPDGKILVAGEVFNSGTNSDMAVVRLNANGAIDTTFGTAGIAIVNFASGADAAWAMAVQPNDKIVLAGTAFDGVGRGFALARLNADGSTDTGFGSGYAAGGRATTDITGSVDTATALALRRDGRIVSAGVAGTQWAVTRSLGDSRPVLTLTDLNADGKSDVLYRNVSTGGVYRMVMGGFVMHHAAPAYSEPNTAWKVVADADFNGDGYSDLLYRNDTTGQVAIVPFEANGVTGTPVIFYTEPNAAWKIVHTPDLDGDGRADILWWNSSTGQVYAMLLNGGAIVAQGLMYAEPDTAWKIVAVGDMDGSGKANQLVWRHGTTGQVYLMTITVAGGAFSQSGVQIYQEPNTAWKILAAADFNGDGKSDLLWRNSTSGQIYVMLMSGSTIQSQGLMYVEPDLAWKIVAQGDYNGDGKADLLWRNETTGGVYMMLINGLAIASQAMVYGEPNTAWKLLGPWEYGQATGIVSDAMAAKALPSTFDGPLLNASPGLSGAPLNRSLDMNQVYPGAAR